MVDRAARDELSRAIRRLVAGLITNDQFADNLSISLHRSRDLAVRSVLFAAWGLYDDLHEHRLEGRYAIGKMGRRPGGRDGMAVHPDQRSSRRRARVAGSVIASFDARSDAESLRRCGFQTRRIW